MGKFYLAGVTVCPHSDIVSEIDMQEVRNAMENANRELSTSWDFRNVPASFELNEKIRPSRSPANRISGGTTDRNTAQKLAKRGIVGCAIELPAELEHSGKTYSVDAKVKQGIETGLAKNVKFIKYSKMKVQAQIQGEQVRGTGDASSALQQVIALVKGGAGSTLSIHQLSRIMPCWRRSQCYSRAVSDRWLLPPKQGGGQYNGRFVTVEA